MDAQLNDLLSRGVSIPAQPGVLMAVAKALQGDEVDVRELAREMTSDAGLTALVFRLARSPRHGGGRVDNLEQAILRVGLRPVFSLARALALKGAIGGDQLLLERFWARSNGVARYASAIAEERVAVCNIFPDQAYLAGVFHHCGVPLLAQRFPAYQALYWETEKAGAELNPAEEDRRVQMDHCVVGFLVARHWGLPDFVAAAIRHHHELEDLEEFRARSMVAILQLALRLHHLDSGVDSPEWFRVHETVMEELGLYREGFEEYLDEIRERAALVEAV